jgi:hypothetical protein
MFRAEGLGAMIPVFRQAWLLPNHILPFTLVNMPRNALAMLGRVAKAAIFIGAGIEMKISLANRVTLSSSRQDIFGRPIAHLIFNFSPEDRALIERTRALIRGWFSQIGATGVREAPVAYPRNLRVHESPNLYLCGCDVFVTGGAMGPTLSIAALALRLADRVVDQLKHA